MKRWRRRKIRRSKRWMGGRIKMEEEMEEKKKR